MIVGHDGEKIVENAVAAEIRKANIDGASFEAGMTSARKHLRSRDRSPFVGLLTFNERLQVCHY